MIDDYMKIFTEQLRINNYSNVNGAEILFRKKYSVLIKKGNSEFEAVIALGDPVEEAQLLCGREYTVEDRFKTNQLHENLEDDLDYKNKSKTVLDVNYDNKDKPKTKIGVYLTDAFFMTPGTLLCGAGTFAMTFISILSVIIGAMYTVMSWIEPAFTTGGARTAAFALSLGVLAAGLFGIYLTYVIIKAMHKGITHYLADRKQNLLYIDAVINAESNDKLNDNSVNSANSDDNNTTNIKPANKNDIINDTESIQNVNDNDNIK